MISSKLHHCANRDHSIYRAYSILETIFDAKDNIIFAIGYASENASGLTATLVTLKVLLSIFSAVWGLFRVFRDGPCKLPAGFRIGAIAFGFANLMYPVMVSITYLLLQTELRTKQAVSCAVIARAVQIAVLLLHGPLWSLWSLKRHLSWSTIAKVIIFR